MTGGYGIKQGKIYRYYTCNTRKKYGLDGCACPNLNAEQIEKFVKDQLFELRNDEEFIAAVISRMPGVADGKVSDCLFNIGNSVSFL